jgi:nicotinamide riboside kinase
VRALADGRPAAALYVITGDENPVVLSGLHDGEHGRAWMQARLREELAARGVPWIEVRGSRDERLSTATTAVDEVVAEGWRLADPVG